jgi:hypothetical protein
MLVVRRYKYHHWLVQRSQWFCGLHYTESIHTGHLDIEKQHIHMLLCNLRKRLSTSSALSADINVCLIFKESAQPSSGKAFVIDDHAAQFHAGRWGMMISTFVPGGLVIRNFAFFP